MAAIVDIDNMLNGIQEMAPPGSIDDDDLVTSVFVM